MSSANQDLSLNNTFAQFMSCMLVAGLIALPVHYFWGDEIAGVAFLTLTWIFCGINRHLRVGWFILSTIFGLLFGFTWLKDKGFF